MPQYKAPMRDMRFLMNEVFDYPAHYASLPNGADATPDTVEAIIEGCASLCENVLSPLNRSGDEEGCHFENGKVTTPKGFKEAYKQFVEGGWQGLSYPTEFGGQNLPSSMHIIKSEMMGTANWSFGMYPGLSSGCMNTLLRYGSEEQKALYMPKLTEGTWSGTMCLTEPHCGSDLGQVRSRAEPQPDGSYALTGTKIFISAGDHDLTENIIHVVLARLPDAPAGTRGISLFLVPKVLVNADGSLGERNAVTTGSLEHKMGIRASATAVLNFDGAKAWMIGQPNRGLEAMFTFMNAARIGTALQGVAHAELSHQGALNYAMERRSMRSLSGTKDKDNQADALIWHADVRRMLLTQKAIAEGGRAMIYSIAKQLDHMTNAIAAKETEKLAKMEDKIGFFTPILKGFLTEMGLEAANLGVQVFGGHGYIKEHGMEQIVRDARISTLYEGTTGIQALDLLGRKVLLQSRGRCVNDFAAEIRSFALTNLFNGEVGPMARTLFKLSLQWQLLTLRIMLRSAKDRETVGAASTDFLMYSGFVTMAYFWAKQAVVAQEKLKAGGKEGAEFYQAKMHTAQFYFERLLPRARTHAKAMLSTNASLMQMRVEHFTPA